MVVTLRMDTIGQAVIILMKTILNFWFNCQSIEFFGSPVVMHILNTRTCQICYGTQLILPDLLKYVLSNNPAQPAN